MNTGILGSENHLPPLWVGSQSSFITDRLVLLISNLGKSPPNACLFGKVLNLKQFSTLRKETIYVKFGSQV